MNLNTISLLLLLLLLLLQDCVCVFVLQLTPGLGVLCAVLILLLVTEPVRGSADHGTQLQSTSWPADLRYLLRQYVCPSMSVLITA